MYKWAVDSDDNSVLSKLKESKILLPRWFVSKDNAVRSMNNLEKTFGVRLNLVDLEKKK